MINLDLSLVDFDIIIYSLNREMSFYALEQI